MVWITIDLLVCKLTNQPGSQPASQPANFHSNANSLVYRFSGAVFRSIQKKWRRQLLNAKSYTTSWQWAMYEFASLKLSSLLPFYDENNNNQYVHLNIDDSRRNRTQAAGIVEWMLVWMFLGCSSIRFAFFFHSFNPCATFCSSVGFNAIRSARAYIHSVCWEDEWKRQFEMKIECRSIKYSVNIKCERWCIGMRTSRLQNTQFI